MNQNGTLKHHDIQTYILQVVPSHIQQSQKQQPWYIHQIYVFKAQSCETDGVGWCRRCMVMNVQLNSAWISEILQLPWKSKLCNSEILHDFSPQLLQTELQIHMQMKIPARNSIKDQGFLMNWWKKVNVRIVKIERICEILDWIWKMIVDSAVSVMIKHL